MDAANILAGIENKLAARPDPAGPTHRRTFEPLAGIRLGASEAVGVSRIGSRILQSVQGLIEGPPLQASSTLALRLAQVAFRLPHLRSEALIDDLLGLPADEETRRDLLTLLARLGETLPAETVRSGVEAYLKKRGPQFHDLSQSQYQLDGWLALFAFADRPDVLLEAIDGLQPFQTRPSALDRLLGALGRTPSPDADRLLLALARRDPAFVSDHGWRTAVLGRGDASAVGIILALVEEGRLKDWRIGNGFRDAGPLPAAIRADPRVRTRVWALYRATRSPLLRRALVPIWTKGTPSSPWSTTTLGAGSATGRICGPPSRASRSSTGPIAARTPMSWSRRRLRICVEAFFPAS